MAMFRQNNFCSTSYGEKDESNDAATEQNIPFYNMETGDVVGALTFTG